MFRCKLLHGTTLTMWHSIVRSKRLQSWGDTEGGSSVFGLGQPCVLTWSVTVDRDTSKGGIIRHDKNESRRSEHSCLTVAEAHFSLICHLSPPPPSSLFHAFHCECVPCYIIVMGVDSFIHCTLTMSCNYCMYGHKGEQNLVQNTHKLVSASATPVKETCIFICWKLHWA